MPDMIIKKVYKTLLSISMYLSIILISGCGQSLSHQENIILIDNINIVDVNNGQIIPGQNIVIKDSLIHAIGVKQKILNCTHCTIIDGSGLYIMPGLWDMHFHGCWDNSIDSLVFPALLKFGITGIRDMGGDLKIQNLWKQKIESNPTWGPNIFGAGPMIDGNPPVWTDFSIAVENHTDINSSLDSLFLGGSDFIKTYSLIQESELRRIASYVKQHKNHFAGHLSEYIKPETSISLGQKSIEHLNRLDDLSFKNRSRLDSIINLMLTYETWLCPTLITYYVKAYIDTIDFRQKDLDTHIPVSLFDEWDLSKKKRMSNKDIQYWPKQKEKFEHQKELVKYLSEAGIPILIGSDFAGMPFVYPGKGLFDEMKLLSDAGITNQEIIKAATLNPAIYFNIQDRNGSIEIGKYADFIILNQNPFKNINFHERLKSVYRKGLIVK